MMTTEESVRVVIRGRCLQHDTAVYIKYEVARLRRKARQYPRRPIRLHFDVPLYCSVPPTDENLKLWSRRVRKWNHRIEGLWFEPCLHALFVAKVVAATPRLKELECSMRNKIKEAEILFSALVADGKDTHLQTLALWPNETRSEHLMSPDLWRTMDERLMQVMTRGLKRLQSLRHLSLVLYCTHDALAVLISTLLEKRLATLSLTLCGASLTEASLPLLTRLVTELDPGVSLKIGVNCAAFLSAPMMVQKLVTALRQRQGQSLPYGRGTTSVELQGDRVALESMVSLYQAVANGLCLSELSVRGHGLICDVDARAPLIDSLPTMTVQKLSLRDQDSSLGDDEKAAILRALAKNMTLVSVDLRIDFWQELLIDLAVERNRCLGHVRDMMDNRRGRDQSVWLSPAVWPVALAHCGQLARGATPVYALVQSQCQSFLDAALSPSPPKPAGVRRTAWLSLAGRLGAAIVRALRNTD